MPRTNYVHAIDGFNFSNSWQMQPGDWDQLRGVIQSTVNALSVHPLASPAVAALPVPPPFSNLILAQIVTDAIVANVRVGAFGLCGGMAFAAADYHRLNWLPQRGNATPPTWSTPEETALRRYIWTRLLDSLQADVALKTLLYMGVYHGIFPFSVLGDRQWLRDRSRDEFRVIRGAIDRGQPWPIGLVGTTDNPMNNHQVLVTGYEFPSPIFGGDSCRLCVYDPNCRNAESVIDFDFTGRRNSEETCPGAQRGLLQGFFAASYTPSAPPPSAQVIEGLASAPTGTVNVGTSTNFMMTVRNAGWGPTLPMKLFVAGRAGGVTVDAGGEATAAALNQGQNRALRVSQTINRPTGTRIYFASSLVESDGQRAWRLLAATGSGRSQTSLAVASPAAGWATRGGILTSPPSAVTASDGRMHVYVVGEDRNAWTIAQIAPNSGWGNWRGATAAPPFGLAGRPTVLRDAHGRHWIVCRSADGGVWLSAQGSVNGSFGGWQHVGNSTPFDPSAVFNADGRAEVFMRRSDGGIGQRWQNPLGWWPPFGWENRGGSGAGMVATARNLDGRLEIFARFADNSLHHSWQTSPGGSWSAWAPFGTDMSGEPAVGVNRDGRLEVFCVSGGNVHHRWQTAPNNGWSGWRNMNVSAAANARVAVVTNSFGGLDAFVRAASNTIHTSGWRPGSGWTAWRDLGGSADGCPAAAVNQDGRVEVFVRGSDRTLQHRWQISPGNWG